MFALGAKTFFLLLALSLIAALIKGFAVDDSGCRTPDGGVGDCISAGQCPKIEAIASKIKSGTLDSDLRDRAIKVLKKYVCNSKNGHLHVCCPRQYTTKKPPEIKRRSLLPYNCGDLDYGDKIANGTVTTLTEFPWMALLGYDVKESQKFKCGGTLINDRYVLTAAHCIRPNLKFVRLGEHDLRTKEDCETPPGGVKFCSEPVQDIPVESTLIHPNYNRTYFSSDIALIRLKRRANISIESVRPICLPITKRLRTKTVEQVVLTGWGVTDESVYFFVLPQNSHKTVSPKRTQFSDRSRQSSVLMKVTVPVVPLDDCRSIYRRKFDVAEGHLCIGGDLSSGSCDGDSGGPLQFVEHMNSDSRYVQFGVISLGPQNCGREEPGVHVRLSKYIDWILKSIRP